VGVGFLFCFLFLIKMTPEFALHIMLHTSNYEIDVKYATALIQQHQAQRLQ
jgi:hypothetical protein